MRFAYRLDTDAFVCCFNDIRQCLYLKKMQATTWVNLFSFILIYLCKYFDLIDKNEIPNLHI